MKVDFLFTYRTRSEAFRDFEEIALDRSIGSMLFCIFARSSAAVMTALVLAHLLAPVVQRTSRTCRHQTHICVDQLFFCNITRSDLRGFFLYHIVLASRNGFHRLSQRRQTLIWRRNPSEPRVQFAKASSSFPSSSSQFSLDS